jgi:hypothetical protein
MAKLLEALTASEIRKIEATAKDREREFEQKIKDRDARREAQRAAAKRTNEKRWGRRADNGCRVCANPSAVDLTGSEIVFHNSGHSTSAPLS